MKRSTLTQIPVALAGASFTATTVAVLLWPEQALQKLGLAASGPAGVIAARAEIAGLFLAIALLCGAGLWTRRRPWVISAAAVLGAVAVTRLVAWIANGGPAGDVLFFVTEVGAALSLTFAAGSWTESEEAAPRRHHMRRWSLALAGGAVLFLAVFAGVAHNPSIQQRMFDRAAERMTATVNTAPLADDAMRVAICGSSAPLPSAARAKACVAVFAGGKFYVVDTGPESTENLVLWGIPLSQVGGVLLTHFHSDHIGDLGELNLQTWAGGRAGPLDVYGGPGIDRVVAGFNEAYKLDQGYRTTHHGEEVMPSATWPMIAHTVVLDGEPTPAKDRTAIVLDDGELRITAIEVNHAPIEPAYAYRFDYKGRSVVVTGDLKDHPPLVASAKGADVLVSEAIALNMTRSLGAAAEGANRAGTAAIMHDIENYHITPQQAARIANEAGVKLLVFYHLLPSPDARLPRQLFAQGLNEVRPDDWTIADDGSMYTLPLGSTDVRIERIDD